MLRYSAVRLAAHFKRPKRRLPRWFPTDLSMWRRLKPLYGVGWAFLYDQPEPTEYVPAVAVLRRTFPFPSPGSSNNLLTFIEKTRDAPLGNIVVFRNFCECDVVLRSPEGPDISRDLFRVAFDAHTAYKQIVGSKYPVPVVNPKLRVTRFREAAVAAQRLYNPRPRPGLHPPSPPIRVPLPLAPTVPAADAPLPSITDADLPIFIAPLVSRGWCITSVNTRFRFQGEYEALSGKPALYRAYRFANYPSARHFLHAVVATIPPRAAATRTVPVQAGVEVQLTGSANMVEIWTISELTGDGAEAAYGISYADVRFAITVETLLADKKWAQDVQETATYGRRVPSSMDEVWDERNFTQLYDTSKKI